MHFIAIFSACFKFYISYKLASTETSTFESQLVNIGVIVTCFCRKWPSKWTSK